LSSLDGRPEHRLLVLQGPIELLELGDLVGAVPELLLEARHDGALLRLESLRGLVLKLHASFHVSLRHLDALAVFLGLLQVLPGVGQNLLRFLVCGVGALDLSLELGDDLVFPRQLGPKHLRFAFQVLQPRGVGFRHRGRKRRGHQVGRTRTDR